MAELLNAARQVEREMIAHAIRRMAGTLKASARGLLESVADCVADGTIVEAADHVAEHRGDA